MHWHVATAQLWQLRTNKASFKINPVSLPAVSDRLKQVLPAVLETVRTPVRMPGPQKRAALWLMPRPGTPIYEALHQLILGLKPLFDDAVPFEPHVTLVSGIQVRSTDDAERILEGTLAAARAVPSLSVILGELSYGMQRFRKVTLAVEKAPELLSLAMVCREAYVLQPQLEAKLPHYHALSADEQQEYSRQIREAAQEWVNSEYTPHVSLVHSSVYTVDEHQRATIDERLQDAFGADYSVRGIGWAGSRVAVAALDEQVENWQVIAYRDV